MSKKRNDMKPMVWSIAISLVISINAIAMTGSQRNGKIAFTSDRDGNREIYIMNADGSDQVRLTTNAVFDDHATFSPNGRKIAYVSQSLSGGFGIYQMDIDGGNKVAITNIEHYPVNPPNFFSDVWSMSWSPDGKHIAFQDFYATYDILVVDINGSNRRILTDQTGWDHEPAWSPDGKRILFSSTRIRAYPTLYTMKPDGSDLQAFPGFDGNWEIAAHWSPDGTKVVFIADHTDNIAHSSIMTENADGSNRQFFDWNFDTFEYRNKPSWSPDGRQIIFDKWVEITGDMEIYVKNTDGTKLVQLTNTSGWNYNPSWQGLPTRVVDSEGDVRSDISIPMQNFDAAQFGISTDMPEPAVPKSPADMN